MAKVTVNVTARDIKKYADRYKNSDCECLKFDALTNCAVANAFKRTKAYDKNARFVVGVGHIRNGDRFVWLSNDIANKIATMTSLKPVEPFKFTIEI